MLDGPSIILGNILREFRPDELALFKRKITGHLQIYNKKGNEVNAKTYSISIPSPYSSKYGNFIGRIIRLLELAMIPITVLKGIWINMIERPACIIATSDPPHCHFLIAGYLISRLLRKKLFLYLFDPLEGFASGRLQRQLFKCLRPLIFRYASKIIVMDEFLAEFYKQKYELQCNVLHHSSNIGNADFLVEDKTTENDIYTIVFSGNISRFQFDALLNLKNAIQLIPDKIRLLIYTPTREESLREMGFYGDSVLIRHCDHEVLMSELKKADILFLPLSFAHSDSIIVKAAFPSKTIDYMEALRPILIHAPLDCFIVNYAEERRFAEIVTENNAASLAKAVESLLADKKRQKELVGNSYKTLMKHRSDLKYKELIGILDIQ